MSTKDSVFSKFTNLYSLSKTLRFELKPVGKTLENMRKQLKYDETLQTFLKDQAIEDAYQILKPIFDELHEQFITQSLESDEAKSISFAEYLVEYRTEEKNMASIEGNLRNEIGKLYMTAGNKWKENYSKYQWKKGSKIASGSDVLSCPDMLQLIKELHHGDEKIKTVIEDTFKGFFTYLGGFNQNRENYYETKAEKATAVATRIVHDNLPKFCDNIISFEARKNEYVGVYRTLKEVGKSLVNKEKKELFPIDKSWFDIHFFNHCLSQRSIETYNELVGNANFLINLYNQENSKTEKFKKLPFFKTLYKQIGCGTRDALFFTLTDEKKSESEEKRNKGEEAFSVQEVLDLANKAGKKYFAESNNDDYVTVYKFLRDIQNRENYLGVYWSKSALNTISNKYFVNYYDLKDRLKVAKVFQKAGEDIKIPEAIELEGLFRVLNETNSWREGGLFRESLTKLLHDSDENRDENKKREKRRNIILRSESASEALLKMIFDDIREHAQEFVSGSSGVLDLEKYADKTGKETIKAWMDHALAVNQMLKYFLVKESKTKGTPLDAAISQVIGKLLLVDDAEWFKWYDALRNFLTKKPQDDAKENKLKLNFECPSLLGGWSNGQEKVKAAVLLKDGNLYSLGILRKKSLFGTEKENNEIYTTPSSKREGRLILANLKFQTLAGKGFLGEFKMSYGDMGEKNPKQAVECLQKIIKDRYSRRYPLLDRIANTSYSDKKLFDKDIQETLKECYVCEFKSINWQKVEQYTNEGEMYLFRIYSKDFSNYSKGNNLQTLYWSAVFLEDSPFQLNGGGEIFYRKHVIREKKGKAGYERKPWVIENKRFTENKQLTQKQGESNEDGKSFFFHCPIKLNYKAKNYSDPKYAVPEINKIVNEAYFGNDTTCFLGIDRGEKHLAYYSFVDKNGKMVDQGTLNLPFTDKDGNPRTVKAEKRTIGRDGKENVEIVDCGDYNKLLDARAGDRNYARKNWQTIGTIKELKEGYISQVVRKIADLATDENYPAFIVLEDLNTGFKRGRQKIEKSVYQKFELALAKKLNFLVDKSAENGKLGSVTNALQLTPPVQNYGDIENKKQVGIMLYTRANYTSQTDPATGWRKSIYLKTGSEESIKDQIIGNGKTGKDEIKPVFSDIYFDGKDYIFFYLNLKGKDEWKGQKGWKLYSGKSEKPLDRFRGERGKDKNEWIIKPQDVVKMLDGLFQNFDKNKSFFSQIVDEGIELTKINEHTAWESLRFAIDLIQQIRNTGLTERDSDFIVSPVRDEDGNHFDSRVFWDAEQRNERVTMPSSGDANGAYNIARKGLIMNEHIRTWSDNGKQKYDKFSSDLNLFISDEEWDLYLADHKQWKGKLPIFSSRRAIEDENSDKQKKNKKKQ